MFQLATHIRRFQCEALLLLGLAGAGLLWMLTSYLWPEKKLKFYERLLEVANRMYTVRLLHRETVGHNTLLLRFALPSREQVLGFHVGQHVLLRTWHSGRRLVRRYTPISLPSQQGSFDIIVKVYRRGTSFSFPDGGTMSQLLEDMQPGDEIQVQGPKGTFEYFGRGRFILFRRLGCLVSRVGLIAAGSGVTPMLQFLRYKFSDYRDVTRIMMVDVNHSLQDIIMRDELEAYARDRRRSFKLCHVLTQMPERRVKSAARYLEGPLTETILREFLPPPSRKTVVLVCGPPSLVSDVCQPALTSIGHDFLRVLVY